jgi:hypothetical protein
MFRALDPSNKQKLFITFFFLVLLHEIINLVGKIRVHIFLKGLFCFLVLKFNPFTHSISKYLMFDFFTLTLILVLLKIELFYI